MFAAGFTGALWLVGLALVVARFYGKFRRWDGWTELKLDAITLSRAIQTGTSSLSTGRVFAGGVGAMLGWSAAFATFLYARSF